jgi:protein-S-isoprenylcysteine O-methyltransferase Ste14
VIGITFFGVKLFNLNALSLRVFDGFYYAITLEANWILFTLAGWLLAILEDRELATHFGEVYEEYAQRVPRLLPN